MPLSSCKLEQFDVVTSNELLPITFQIAKKLCHLCVLNPVVLDIVNTSLQMGVFPSTLKEAMLKPILKNSNLDYLESMNF